MITKKIFIVLMSNNTPETMTRQQSHSEKNREKSEKYIKSSIKITKNRFRK